MFFRAIVWAESCRKEVDFVHLNANYKSGVWGACCGKNGVCRESTWNWLFPVIVPTAERGSNSAKGHGTATMASAYKLSSFKKEALATYSSAQFSVSGTQHIFILTYHILIAFTSESSRHEQCKLLISSLPIFFRTVVFCRRQRDSKEASHFLGAHAYGY